MNKLLKNTIYVLMLLISTYQAIHAIGHLVNHHDNLSKEYAHFNEHKCSLCHINITPLLPEENTVTFEWHDNPKQQEIFALQESNIQTTQVRLFNLRAPPIKM